MLPESLLIDQITYTASLATNFRDIDPILDTLREITANMIDSTQPLSTNDHAKLLAIQEQLETYLTTKEPLRQFTTESLRLQIEQHMQGNIENKSRKQLIAVITVATLFSLGTGFFPLSSLEQHLQVGGATEFSLLTVGAAWLFWTALPAFKSELRQAFLYICIGVTLLGLSMLEQPILDIFNLRHYSITSLLFPLPVLIAAILFHTGDAFYVRLLGIKNRWTTPLPVLVSGVVLSVITLLIPHAATSEPELVHNIAAVIWAWILVMPIASLIILPLAEQKLPELYKPPIRLLFQSMFPIIAVIVYQYIIRVVVGPYFSGFVAYGLIFLVILMGLALLRAGYGFNKVSRY